MADVTNPGTVNVADQAFGVGLPTQIVQTNIREPVNTSPNNEDGGDSEVETLVVDQPVTVSPASAFVTDLMGDGGDARPVVIEQPVTVTPQTTPVLVLDGGNFHPGGVPIDIIENDVVGQVYGVGTPINVFV
jgi:hypothetical protein